MNSSIGVGLHTRSTRSRARYAAWMAGFCLLAGCAAEEPTTQQGGNVSSNMIAHKDPLDTGIQRYFVTTPVTICADPSDLHARIDQLMLGNPDHEPSGPCRSLPAGAVLLMERPGHRPTVEYRQFPIEQAMLPDGTPVWSDELGDANVQLVGDAVKR